MPLSVAILLAGFAEAEGERLNLIGAGWTVRDPEPAGSAAIGVMLYVPRELEGKEINTRLTLMYDDTNEPVLVSFPEFADEERPLVVEGPVSATGRKDVKTPLTVGLAVNLPPFHLPPGREFRWQLFLDDDTRDEWAVHFRTTPPPGGSVDQPPQSPQEPA